MSDNRTLRIFCPIHEAGFEAPGTPKILCEITGHSLSTNFPNGEVWEFCCNCETYSLSGMGKGEKARSYCFSCQNEISRRFACSDCQVVSFECGTKSRGQKYAVTAEGIKPACPGCQMAMGNPQVLRHECDDIGVPFFTTRETCPFCLEGTSVAFVMPNAPAPTAASTAATTGCPNCHAPIPIGTSFCGKCRFQLRSVPVENRGSGFSRTQALGSLCPNCSTPIPQDSDFCGECGQAVKSSVLPPPPPPPPRRVSTTGIDSGKGTDDREIFQAELSDVSSIGKPDAVANVLNNPLFKIIGFTVGGIFLITLVIIALRPTSETAANSTNNVGSASTKPNTTKPSTPSVKETPNSNNADYRIGKTAYLVRDTNLRDYAGNIDDSGKIGTHYRDARIRILDVVSVTDKDGNSFDWFKIQVLSTGTSMDANNAHLDKNPGSQDVGWIHSTPTIYIGSSRTRGTAVRFE